MRLLIIFLFSIAMLANAVQAEGTAFRHIKVSGTTGDYIVTGESKAKSGRIYITAEDGHVELIKETAVKTTGKSGEWQPFHIRLQIPKAKLPANGTVMLNLYERCQGGQVTNFYPAILEKFN